LYRGVDLMVFDAQYTLAETVVKENWGHAAASIGIDLAMREGIKKVLFMHHDPASGNDKIADAVEQTRKYYESQRKALARSGQASGSEVEWGFAYEGMTVEV
jgi:ribonuclease BN (tRNA processing enzyme)